MSTHDDDRGNVPSASGMPRAAHCPSSFLKERKFREGTSVYDGEFLHQVTVEERPIRECNYEQTEAVLKAKRQRALTIELTIEEYEERIVEERVWLHDGIKPIMSGRFDELLIKGNHALLIDYKFGWLPVTHAEANMQLRSLAVLVRSKYKVNNIYVAIIAPRSSSKPTIAWYKENDLVVSEAAVKDICRKALDPATDEYNAGDWCNYCRRRHVCGTAWAMADDKLEIPI